MTRREAYEVIEEKILSPAGTLSRNTQGRLRPEEPCPLRTEFQRDRDRIIHSKSFRRMKYKTQVFFSGGGDHYRTRLTHTLEVTQIGRTIARGLGLNEDLTEAIGLGHDLGHTPFGHAGERTLDRLMQPEYSFAHNEQSLRIVDVLEGGRGMNLTAEVRDGILHHTGEELPFTPEGMVIRHADRIAYVNHDIDDAIRIGLLQKEDLPGDYCDFLGSTHASRINALVNDIIDTSEREGKICFSPTGSAALENLRVFLYKNVYTLPAVVEEEEKGCRVLEQLFNYYLEHPEEISESIPGDNLIIRVKDYVAGMTDEYALQCAAKLQGLRV